MTDFSEGFKANVEMGGTCFSCGKPWLYDEFVGIFYCEECDTILTKLPLGRMYMLLGDTGTGKSVLLNKILDIHLRNKRPCVFVAFDDHPSQLRETMGKYVRNLGDSEKLGLMDFIDCYSCAAGVESEEKSSIKSPADINGLNLLLSTMLGNLTSFGPPTVCIDSLSKSFIHCESNLVLKFIAATAVKLKMRKGSLFFTLGTGTVSSEIQKRLEQLSDGLIELRRVESEGKISRQFRISKIRGALYYENWLPFFVGKSSIYLSAPTGTEELKHFNRIFKMIAES